MKTNPANDPLAHASAVPDVGALITEFTAAQNNGACHIGNIGASEDVRYNRWPGKSNPADGCRWQENQPQGKIARPYNGAPDTDVNLADEICRAEVNAGLTAYRQAQFGARSTHFNKLTASQIAEIKAVGVWIKDVIAEDLEDDAELLEQIKASLGWAVLNPGWHERNELVMRTVDMESLRAMAMQAPEGSIQQSIDVLVLSPELEDAAIEVAQMFFPNMDKSTAQKVIRDLRENGSAEFLDKQLAEKRPCIRTLIPGYNLFISGTGGKLKKARGILVIERFYQADLENLAASNGWNKEFVEAVVSTAGQYSTYGEAMRGKALQSEQGGDFSIEIWHTYINQFDPDIGAAGIYCTSFSPHLNPGINSGRTSSESPSTPESFYARHYLLDYAHGEYPFIQARREVIGPSLDDSRGVPDMVRSDQKVIKNLQDAGVARAHLEVNPPRARLGSGWTKTKGGLAPGDTLDGQFGDIKDLGPSKGNPEAAEVAIRRVEAGTRRRFGQPNTVDGSHPSIWMQQQQVNATRTLGTWSSAYWQLMVLTYQNLESWELEEIIGRPPQLTVDDILRHRIQLGYDARSQDLEWTETVLDFVVKLLGLDKGGLMDTSKIIQIALSHIDPTLVTEIMQDKEGANTAMYRMVESDINSIMLGNPPQLRENDASAGMQLQMAYAVLGKNQVFQRIAEGSEQIRNNLETYLQNLQHNVQETTLSPQQGRFGVQETPQKPAMSGTPMLAGGAGY